MKSIYLDLFDDHLYDLKGSSPSTRDDLVAALRMQIFLAILFKVRIIVPEQWLCSSYLFSVVGGEVLSAWQDARDRAARTGGPAPNYPFEFVYFSRDGLSGRHLPSAAFIDRLSRGSALRLSPTIAGVGDHTKVITAKLLEVIREEANSPFPVFGETFESRSADAIGESTTPKLLSTILRLSTVPEAENTSRTDKEYHFRLAESVTAVEKALRTPGAFEHPDARSVGFRSFFARVRQERISFHEITRMWGIANSMDPRVRDSVTLMGRYCMHRALATWGHASNAAASYRVFTPEPIDEFDEVLFQTANRPYATQSNGTRALPSEPEHFLLDQSCQFLDATVMTGQTELMKKLWIRAFEIANDPKWHDEVERVKSKYNKSRQLLEKYDILRELFYSATVGKGLDISLSEDPEGTALFFARFKFAGSDTRPVAGAVIKSTVAATAMALANPMVGVMFGFLAELLDIRVHNQRPGSLLKSRVVARLITGFRPFKP